MISGYVYTIRQTIYRQLAWGYAVENRVLSVGSLGELLADDYRSNQ